MDGFIFGVPVRGSGAAKFELGLGRAVELGLGREPQWTIDGDAKTQRRIHCCLLFESTERSNDQIFDGIYSVNAEHSGPTPKAPC